eukprot:SAG31_NODE_110_length_24476_cov_9.909654_15_plen_41_part_00
MLAAACRGGTVHARARRARARGAASSSSALARGMRITVQE